MNTLAVKIDLQPKQPWSEILIAELSNLNFDAFEETEKGLIAYGDEALIDQKRIINETVLATADIDFQINFEVIPQQNWNATWEADFQPVFVDNELSILAPFHEKELRKKINIEILPKMSFGTGHHQTTWMMAKAMLKDSKLGENVLDMGTGTGVLAILAEKLGSKHILAIDIEDWSVENTIENAERNQCLNIVAKLGDVDLIEGLKFDYILANINKNVLKLHLNSYLSALNSNGKMLLSGFFESDCEEMILFAENLGFKFDSKQTKESWAQLTFKR